MSNLERMTNHRNEERANEALSSRSGVSFSSRCEIQVMVGRDPWARRGIHNAKASARNPGLLKLNDELRNQITSALAVCGVAGKT
jgi:hypothetical protein